MSEWVITLFTWLLFLTSFLGAVLPIIPSSPFLLAGIVFYGYFHGWQGLGVGFWLITAALIVTSWLLDYSASHSLVGRRATSPWTSRMLLLGMILGPFFLGPFGLIIGPIGAAMGAELSQGAGLGQAISIGLCTLSSLLIGIIAKVASIWLVIFWFWHSVRK